VPDLANFVGYLVGVAGGMAALYQTYVGKPKTIAEAKALEATSKKTLAEAQAELAKVEGIKLQNEEIKARQDSQAAAAFQDMTVRLTQQNGLIQTQLQETLARYHEQVMKNSDLEGQNLRLMRQLDEMQSESISIKRRIEAIAEAALKQQKDQQNEIEAVRVQFRELEQELKESRKKENGK
jgi:hypothetical protein